MGSLSNSLFSSRDYLSFFFSFPFLYDTIRPIGRFVASCVDADLRKTLRTGPYLSPTRSSAGFATSSRMSGTILIILSLLSSREVPNEWKEHDQGKLDAFLASPGSAFFGSPRRQSLPRQHLNLGSPSIGNMLNIAMSSSFSFALLILSSPTFFVCRCSLLDSRSLNVSAAIFFFFLLTSLSTSSKTTERSLKFRYRDIYVYTDSFDFSLSIRFILLNEL